MTTGAVMGGTVTGASVTGGVVTGGVVTVALKSGSSEQRLAPRLSARSASDDSSDLNLVILASTVAWSPLPAAVEMASSNVIWSS